jgi:hypothetical protein
LPFNRLYTQKNREEKIVPYDYVAMWMSVSLFIATPLLLRPRPPGAPPLLRRLNNRRASNFVFPKPQFILVILALLCSSWLVC